MGNAGCRQCGVRSGGSCGEKVFSTKAGLVVSFDRSGPLRRRLQNNVVNAVLRDIPALRGCSSAHRNKCNNACNSIMGVPRPLTVVSSGVVSHCGRGMGVFTGLCTRVRLFGKLGCGLGLAPSFSFRECGGCLGGCSFKLTAGDVARLAREREEEHGVLIRGLLAFSHAFKRRGVSTLTNCACRSDEFHRVRTCNRKLPRKLRRVSTTAAGHDGRNGS